MSKHALVVGAQIEGLTGADYDAGRMHDLLTARGFAVELRTGDAATRAGILAGYDALIARVSAGDAAAIYYSGHGLYSINSDPDDALRIVQSIAPTDLRAGSDDDFRGITAWELSIKLAQLTARTRNVTVILDCCHATQMTRDGAADALVPLALPHPIRMGFRSHLRALERGYGHVRVDPVGNPDAVRVVACGQHEPAFEHTNPDGRRAGIFTQALIEILGNLGAAPISWAAVGDAIRTRVMRRFLLQRPEVEGPAERQVFSLAIDPPRDVVAVTRSGPPPGDAGADSRAFTAELFTLHAGWITGVTAGDRYAVMPLGADRHDAQRAIATLRVTAAGAMASTVEIERWSPGHATLPDDAVAIPVERHAATLAIAVIAPAAEHAVIAQALADTRTLHAAPPATLHTADAPIATLRLAAGQLTIEDAGGPLFPPARYPGELDDAIHLLVNLGGAHQIRALVGEHGLAAGSVAIAWGVVEHGVARPLPEHGAALGLGDRIYVTAKNTDEQRRYIHILNIGVRGKVTLLTKVRDPAGVALDPGAQLTLGEHHGRLTGLALTWPAGLAVDRGPRTDELFTIVTTRPISLRGLETHDRTTRGAWLSGSGLHDLLAVRHAGQLRSIARPVAPDAFYVHRLSHVLHPRTAALADTVAFQIDDDPQRHAAERDATAWLPTTPAHAPTGARSAAIAIRFAALEPRRAAIPELGNEPGNTLRIDALVCTRSTQRSKTYAACTLRLPDARPGVPLALPGSLFDGQVCDFVDLYLWISHAAIAAPDLAERLAAHTAAPEVRDAVTALCTLGTTAPWITSVGASTALARAAHDLLGHVQPRGLYRGAWSARDRFGLGRQPHTGSYHAPALTFALAIETSDQ